ncbi:MAG TPA: 2,3-diphosphoglycerate-dependent phosphoglycerate mutase [Acidimicrobiales bacterium]|nr:2,3-diphosphoglycerate-dependent phosphoglycerate mutase [Acidimicrobiales bacterium]
MVNTATRLILLRHGQSQWNLENRFTGWFDVDLTEKGIREASQAGALLEAANIRPDVVHTSLQTRAIETANLALSAADRLWVPVRRSWRLNERHYGALTGLDKDETVALHGAQQVHLWRRSYSTAPPEMPAEHPYNPNNDARYASIPNNSLPRTECLADVVKRLVPYWQGPLAEDLRESKTVLVAAHGNSLRALVKHLQAIPDNEISDLEIPTGAPIIYDLNAALEPTESLPIADRYLG